MIFCLFISLASDSTPQAVDDKGQELERRALNGQDPSKNKNEMNGILMAGMSKSVNV